MPVIPLLRIIGLHHVSESPGSIKLSWAFVIIEKKNKSIFHVILGLLPLPIQAQKGGLTYGIIYFILSLRHGECACLLHLQMVGRR